MENATLEQAEDVVVRLPMPKARFLNWNPDDGFLYEYDHGYAEPTEPTKKEERYLVRNIQDKFFTTSAFQQKGRLYEETEVWLTADRKRIPDVAFFTDAQIRESAEGTTEPIPAFVVELISPSDRAGKIEEKVIEYFSAGVQVVWHVFPALRMVRVFTSPRHSVTCFEADRFSAAPAITDLELTANELFSQ